MPSSDDDKTIKARRSYDEEKGEEEADKDKEVSNLLLHDFRFNCQLISFHFALLPK